MAIRKAAAAAKKAAKEAAERASSIDAVVDDGHSPSIFPDFPFLRQVVVKLLSQSIQFLTLHPKPSMTEGFVATSGGRRSSRDRRGRAADVASGGR